MATVGTEWIQDFHPPPGCNQNQLSWCAAGSQGFGSAMRNRGHTWNFDWGDDNAWETDWRDPSKGGDSGNTQGGCNSVNFTYLSTHGGPVKDLSLIHISEPTRLGMISYAVFCLKKKKNK